MQRRQLCLALVTEMIQSPGRRRKNASESHPGFSVKDISAIAITIYHGSATFITIRHQSEIASQPTIFRCKRLVLSSQSKLQYPLVGQVYRRYGYYR